MIRILVLMAGFLLASTMDTALAKRGGDESRSEFYGIVQVQPQNGRQGEWVIGGQVFMVDSGTEFDEAEGPLEVGSCAKVKIRKGRIHEIDSEPMKDCR
jgi:hypothetical protein